MRIPKSLMTVSVAVLAASVALACFAAACLGQGI
jgi:hypothetical protein